MVRYGKHAYKNREQ